MVIRVEVGQHDRRQDHVLRGVRVVAEVEVGNEVALVGLLNLGPTLPSILVVFLILMESSLKALRGELFDQLFSLVNFGLAWFSFDAN